MSLVTLTYACQFFISSFKPTTSIHLTSMNIEISNLCHASKHMKCTFKCTIQVHELAPPTCVLKILIDSFPLSYLSPYVKFSPYHLYLYFSPLWCLFTIFVHYFSPFIINDHKGLKCRQVEIIKVNQWGEDHFPKFDSNQIIC